MPCFDTSLGGRQSIYNRRSVAPKNPKIYHITHVENLPQIVDNLLGLMPSVSGAV